MNKLPPNVSRKNLGNLIHYINSNYVTRCNADLIENLKNHRYIYKTTFNKKYGSEYNNRLYFGSVYVGSSWVYRTFENAKFITNIRNFYEHHESDIYKMFFKNINLFSVLEKKIMFIIKFKYCINFTTYGFIDSKNFITTFTPDYGYNNSVHMLNNLMKDLFLNNYDYTINITKENTHICSRLSPKTMGNYIYYIHFCDPKIVFSDYNVSRLQMLAIKDI